MTTKINLTNQRFGRLNVIRDSKERTGHGHIIWLCKCICGKQVKVISGNLRYGHTRSCGCLKEEHRKIHGKANLRHGENDKSRLYVAWINLKRKCYNRNAINYKNYGGKKARVCGEWLDRKTGYISFRAWALNNGYFPGLRLFFIARKDCRKNYGPDNCWLTPRSNWMKKKQKTIMPLV